MRPSPCRWLLATLFACLATFAAAETGDGLWASYYPNMTLADEPVVERIDPQVNFIWGSGSPDGLVPVDGFSARWEGWVVPETTGVHTFYVRTDDGVRLYVGGNLVVDQWRNQGPTEKAATVTLQSSEPVSITIEYFENTGGAVAEFRWLPPGGVKEIVPQRVLYTEPPTTPMPPTGGLLGHYFDNTDLYGEPVLVQFDAEPQFEWGSESPSPDLPVDSFSVRWLGTVTAPVAGTYTFATRTDDGANLWLDGELVVDDWVAHGVQTHATRTFELAEGQVVNVVFEYFESGGGAIAEFLWSIDGSTLHAVPTFVLSPDIDNSVWRGTGTGLIAKYHDNTKLDGDPVLERIDANVDFDWGSGGPDASLPVDKFSVEWNGCIETQYDEVYTLEYACDDGALIWVNGKLIINDWVTRSATRTATFQGHAGQKLPIRICHYENTGGARAKLYWESDSRPRQLVPQDRLYPELAFGVDIPTSSITSPVFIEGAVPENQHENIEAVAGGTDYDAIRLAKNSFFVDVALDAGAPTAVSLGMAGGTSTTGQIAWTPTLIDNGAQVVIRKGDSLLLQATPDDQLTIYENCGVAAGPLTVPESGLLPYQFTTAGIFEIKDGDGNGREVKVVGVTYVKPVACEVGYTRTLDVPVDLDSDDLVFVPNDATEMVVRETGYDAETQLDGLSLTPSKRGAPKVLARLVDGTGPILFLKDIDEFTLVVEAAVGVGVFGNIGQGVTKVYMHPYIPGIFFNAEMFASKSTFEGGATSLRVNTDDFDQQVDAATGETIGVHLYVLEIPDNETKYCFRTHVSQVNSPELTISSSRNHNGGVCRIKVKGGTFIVTETTDESEPNLIDLKQQETRFLPKWRHFIYAAEGEEPKYDVWFIKVKHRGIISHAADTPDGDPALLSDDHTVLTSPTTGIEGGPGAIADIAGPCIDGQRYQGDFRFYPGCSTRWPASDCEDCIPGTCVADRNITGVHTGYMSAEVIISMHRCDGTEVGAAPLFRICRLELDGYTGPGDVSSDDAMPNLLVSWPESPPPETVLGNARIAGTPVHVTLRGPEGTTIPSWVKSRDPGKVLLSSQPSVEIPRETPTPQAAGLTELLDLGGLTIGEGGYTDTVVYAYALDADSTNPASNVASLEVIGQETSYVPPYATEVKTNVVGDREKTSIFAVQPYGNPVEYVGDGIHLGIRIVGDAPGVYLEAPAEVDWQISSDRATKMAWGYGSGNPPDGEQSGSGGSNPTWHGYSLANDTPEHFTATVAFRIRNDNTDVTTSGSYTFTCMTVQAHLDEDLYMVNKVGLPDEGEDHVVVKVSILPEQWEANPYVESAEVMAQVADGVETYRLQDENGDTVIIGLRPSGLPLEMVEAELEMNCHEITGVPYRVKGSEESEVFVAGSEITGPTGSTHAKPGDKLTLVYEVRNGDGTVEIDPPDMIENATVVGTRLTIVTKPLFLNSPGVERHNDQGRLRLKVEYLAPNQDDSPAVDVEDLFVHPVTTVSVAENPLVRVINDPPVQLNAVASCDLGVVAVPADLFAWSLVPPVTTGSTITATGLFSTPNGATGTETARAVLSDPRYVYEETSGDCSISIEDFIVTVTGEGIFCIQDAPVLLTEKVTTTSGVDITGRCVITWNHPDAPLFNAVGSYVGITATAECNGVQRESNAVDVHIVEVTVTPEEKVVFPFLNSKTVALQASVVPAGVVENADLLWSVSGPPVTLANVAGATNTATVPSSASGNYDVFVKIRGHNHNCAQAEIIVIDSFRFYRSVDKIGQAPWAIPYGANTPVPLLTLNARVGIEVKGGTTSDLKVELYSSEDYYNKPKQALSSSGSSYTNSGSLVWPGLSDQYSATEKRLVNTDETEGLRFKLWHKSTPISGVHNRNVDLAEVAAIDGTPTPDGTAFYEEMTLAAGGHQWFPYDHRQEQEGGGGALSQAAASSAVYGALENADMLMLSCHGRSGSIWNHAETWGFTHSNFSGKANGELEWLILAACSQVSVASVTQQDHQSNYDDGKSWFNSVSGLHALLGFRYGAPGKCVDTGVVEDVEISREFAENLKSETVVQAWMKACLTVGKASGRDLDNTYHPYHGSAIVRQSCVDEKFYTADKFPVANPSSSEPLIFYWIDHSNAANPQIKSAVIP